MNQLKQWNVWRVSDEKMSCNFLGEIWAESLESARMIAALKYGLSGDEKLDITSEEEDLKLAEGYAKALSLCTPKFNYTKIAKKFFDIQEMLPSHYRKDQSND